MPKAKLFKNHRLTKAPKQNRNRKKEDGRPKGTLKRFKFEETKLGFMLKHEVPVVYDIIINLTPKAPFVEPPILLVKKICGCSPDPSLRKPKFKRYLDDYAKNGLYCKRAQKITPSKKRYYEGIRKKKMERFIKENRTEIDKIKQFKD